MKKWLIGVIILIFIFLSTITALAYFVLKTGKRSPTENHKRLTPKLALSKRFGISLGGNWPELSDEELESALDDIAGLGFTWIRFDVSWERAQPEKNGPIRWEEFDRIFPAAAKRKLNLLPILTYAPKWAAMPIQEEVFFQLAPADPDQFADFAAKAARRYSPMGIHTYEIWNEPNLKGFWEPASDPKDYTEVLKKSYIKIKQVDPKAFIVSGGLAPVKTRDGNISALEFLEEVYENGGKNYFDALAFHPYAFPDLPGEKLSPSGWWARMSNPISSIRSVMDANGDEGKQIWGTEFGVPTFGRKDVSESLQAKSIASAAEEMQDMPWLRILFIHTYKDLAADKRFAENSFGLVRFDGTKKPAYYTTKKLLKEKTNRENKRYKN